MYEPQIFNKTDTDAWKRHLDIYGYVVLGDILDEEARETLFSTFRKDWNTVSPAFNFEDPSSWSMSIHCCSPMVYGKGMAVYSGFGNSDFMWGVRLQPSIKSVYEQIYQTKELVVSMDCFSFFFTHEQKSKPWLHVDQHPTTNRYSIQGSYNFLPVTRESAGFVVVPGSHQLYRPATPSTKVADWIVVEGEDLDFFSQYACKLIIPSNCFTLWNSKTIHANTGITGKRPNRLDRLTCYVTYMPASLRPASVKEDRVRAYLAGETTSHWATRCEIKTYPYGFGPTYEKRGYGRIKPRLDSHGEIPLERAELL